MARDGAEIAATWNQIATLCPEVEGGLAAALATLALLALRPSSS